MATGAPGNGRNVVRGNEEQVKHSDDSAARFALPFKEEHREGGGCREEGSTRACCAHPIQACPYAGHAAAPGAGSRSAGREDQSIHWAGHTLPRKRRVCCPAWGCLLQGVFKLDLWSLLASQNHRGVEAEGVSGGHLVQQGHPEQVALEHIQAAFELFPRKETSQPLWAICARAVTSRWLHAAEHYLMG